MFFIGNCAPEFDTIFNVITACPHLPDYDPGKARRHGADRGAAFYLDALRFAQANWMEGKPAQAILQLNKAFSADLSKDDPVLQNWPLPYAALSWIITRAADGSHGFLGNPVRHFQHLATRMCGPNRETRIDRAWKCFHLSRHLLEGKADFPLDGRQIAREGIFIPSEKP